jgi:hypothetical protein
MRKQKQVYRQRIIFVNMDSSGRGGGREGGREGINPLNFGKLDMCYFLSPILQGKPPGDFCFIFIGVVDTVN